MLKRLLKLNAFFLISLALFSFGALAADISFNLPFTSYLSPDGYPVYQDNSGLGVSANYNTALNQNVCELYWYLDGNEVQHNKPGCHGYGTSYHFFDADDMAPGLHTIKFKMTGWEDIPIPLPYSYSESVKVYINALPTAFISTPTGTTVKEGESITFSGADSVDTDGSIVKYEWDFDGDYVYDISGSVVTHVYNTPGTYTVRLKVTDNYGGIDYTSTTITVELTPINEHPLANISADPISGDVPLTVLFRGTGSYDPDGTIISYNWDFGDGTQPVVGLMTVQHTYNTVGIFYATLTVTDNDGAIDSKTVEITVTQPSGNTAPQAIFTADPTSGDAPLTVDFDASASYDPDGTIISYEWNFGDGNSATGITTSHTYSTAGTYTPTLTVTDNDGAIDTASQTITVTSGGNVAPIVEITSPADGAQYNAGESITVFATASDSTDYIKGYAWKLDGTIYESAEDGFGTSLTKSYTFSSALLTVGYHTITFEAKDNYDIINSDSITIEILGAGNQAPIADFTASIGPSLTVDFDASASYDPDGTIVSYDWDFGDGNTASGVTVIHTYATSGTYTVTLIVADNEGATGTHVETINVPGVSNIVPLARFSYTNTSQFDFQFVDTSYDPDGAIVYREWFFENYGEETFFEGDYINWTKEENNYTITLLGIGQINDKLTATFSVTKNSTDTETFSIGEGEIASFFIDTDGKAAVGIYVEDILGLGSSVDVIIGDGWVEKPTPTFTFPDYGDYTVILKVKDDKGAENSSLRIINIPTPNEIPIADAGPDRTIMRNTTVNFTGTGSDPDGKIVKYEWDFDGDGIFDWENESHGNASYNYTELGVYAAMLRVTDDDGATANDTAYIYVTLPANQIPVPNAGTDQTVDVNTVVNFVGTAIDYDGYITLYEWDFDGDGIYDWSSYSTGVTSYIYNTAGVYYAKLRVTDNEGAVGYDTVIITVRGPSVSSRTETITYDFGLHALDVVRIYHYDSSTALTSYTLRVTNLISDNRTLLVREFIPKNFATDIDDIVISKEPDFVYNRDPEIGWNITLEGFESWEVSLTFHKYIDYGNFTENMSKPSITEFKATEEGIKEEELKPSGVDLTGLAFGLLSNPWFGLLVLIIVIVLAIAFWKKDKVLEIWEKLKARLE